MKDWAIGFWKKHGERFVFIALALILCTVMWQIETLRAEAATVLVMILGILVNKIRSPAQEATPPAVYYPIEPSDPGNQSGQARVATLIAMTLLAAVLAFGFTGCAPNQQTATGQIVEQTSDPGAIALAVFADAQDAYIEALELYRPYREALRAADPDLDAEIIGYFRKANTVLDDWEQFGDVPVEDKAAFRGYLREVSIRTAQLIDARNQ